MEVIKIRGYGRLLSDVVGRICLIIHVVRCLRKMDTSWSGPNQMVTELVERPQDQMGSDIAVYKISFMSSL